MKNCPMCGQDYYDEVKWCPDCRYDFPPAGDATPETIDREDRIRRLLDAAGGDPEKLWRLSPEYLKSAAEYETAKSRLQSHEEA